MSESKGPAVFITAGVHKATINGETVGCGATVQASQYGMVFCPGCDRMVPPREVTK